MPAPPPTTNAPNNTYYSVAAFVAVLFALIAGFGLFVAAEGDPNSAAAAPLELKGSLDSDAKMTATPTVWLTP